MCREKLNLNQNKRKFMKELLNQQILEKLESMAHLESILSIKVIQ